jgi:hypothetical protein
MLARLLLATVGFTASAALVNAALLMRRLHRHVDDLGPKVNDAVEQVTAAALSVSELAHTAHASLADGPLVVADARELVKRMQEAADSVRSVCDTVELKPLKRKLFSCFGGCCRSRGQDPHDQQAGLVVARR